MSSMKKPFTPRVPHKYIGAYLPRADGYEKASGLAKYSEDLTLKRNYPDMVYMKFLKCPYPNARIKRLDTAKAEALPGVKGILKYTDPEILAVSMTSAGWTDATGTTDQKRSMTLSMRDRSILGGHGHWAGDEVGVAIAADTVETVEEALGLLDVEWEELPFLLHVEDSIKPDAPIMHPNINPESNFMPYDEDLGPDTIVDRGDVEQGFKESDVVIETECRYGNPQQCALDYWNCMVDWSRDGSITVISDSYAADQTRMHLNSMLDVPLNKIRVISPFEGGQHGRGDTGDQPFFLVTALMSKKLRRPVKYSQTRKEHFHDTRTSVIAKVRMGAKKDGTIISVDIDELANQGGYADLGLAAYKWVPEEWAETCAGKVPNFRFTGRGVYTNIIPSSCMRAVGNVQMNYIFGLALDMLAEKLGKDPVELAIQNVTCHNIPTPNPCVEEVLRAAAEEIGWERRHAAGQGEVANGKRRGMGFSINNTWHTENHEVRRGETKVMIKINPDGSIILDAPTVEVGAGSNNCAVIACAEGLGVTPESIHWISVQDTQTGLKDQVQTDSAVSYVLAEAVQECAAELKAKLLESVAKKMKWKAEDMDMDEGRIFIKGSPDKSLTIKDYYDSVDIYSEDTLTPMVGYFSRELSGVDVGTAFMATFAEVEVDEETGMVEVVKMVVASDGGTVLFPPGAEGQLVGGQCQGLGEAMYETMIYDEATGLPLNFNFVDYHFPTMADMPDIVPMPMEVFQGQGKYGCSGMGEGAPCCTPRAIENAVYNAIGARISSTPVTPMKVLEALSKGGR